MKRIILISLILGMVVFASAMLAFQIHEVPTLTQVKKSFSPSVRIVLDRDGQIIDQVRIKKASGKNRLPWIGISQIPAHLRELLLRSEGWRLGYETSGLVQRSLGRNNTWMKALAINMAWRNEQILEAFINLSIFNGEMQGLNSLSFALFDKPALELDRSESALVIALLYHSLSDVESLRKNACALLEKAGSFEDCALLSIRHLNYLAQSFNIQPYMKIAPHLARVLSDDEQLRDQLLIRSTLDRKAQWTALHALQATMQDGAIVAMENATGNVLVYVGNMGATSKLAYADGAMVPHGSGATLKPFVFAQALNEHIVTASTSLAKTTVRYALMANLNVPAVGVLELVGPDSFVRTLKQLGFVNLEHSGFYGPSLVLGSAEVRLLELTNAYRTLANKGRWSEVRFSPDLISESAPKNIFSKAAAFLVSDILSKNSKTSFWSAGQCLDNWCLGYSEKFTVGVWSEGSGASEIWNKVMGHLHQSERSETPFAPDGLSQIGNEWYLKGTEPDPHEPNMVASIVSSRISFPHNHSLIAVAPESVRKKSELFIQVVAPRADQNLYLNGRRLGRAQPLQAWDPESGHYTLELRDSQGQVLDKVQFEVRGRRFAQNL